MKLDRHIEPGEIDRETALRHKRGFEALRQAIKDIHDTPPMDTPEQVDQYLLSIPRDLRGKITYLLKDIAARLQGETGL